MKKSFSGLGLRFLIGTLIIYAVQIAVVAVVGQVKPEWLDNTTITLILSVMPLYLIGMPVFAAGGGIGYLFKPTFGFLAGFFVAVCLMGVMKTGPLMKCTAGLLADYLTGFFWYLFMMYAVYQQPLGMIAAFINCFTTIIPDYLLCLCACAIARRLAPVVRHG